MTDNLYEGDLFERVSGDCLRPGGFLITKIAVEGRALHKKARLLDLGCGSGASMEFLHENYGLECVGADISEKLVSKANSRSGIKAVWAEAEDLPFDDSSFDAVLCECVFSLFQNREKVFGEIHRVLAANGSVMISNLYSLEEYTGTYKCTERLFNKEEFVKELDEAGFGDIKFYDFTRELRILAAKAIMEYGSLDNFLQMFTGDEQSGFSSLCKEIKLGYGLWTAQKKQQEAKHGRI